MGDCKTSQKKILAAERRIKAFELRKAGVTFKQIGEVLGCSEQRCHQIMSETMKRLNTELAEGVDDVTRMELERLDAMFLGMWNRAKSGDEKAVDAALKIMARRARLLGLDAPTRVEQTGDAVITVTLPDMGGEAEGEGDEPETPSA